MDSKGALAELKNFQGTRKSAGDYYTQAQSELGVGDAKTRQDDLRGLIRNTETALKGVGQSVAGRTRGNLVTEAQRARLQNIETQPIAQQLADRTGEFSDAQANYRDLLGQAGQRAGMSYQTDSDRQTALQSIYDRLFGQEQADAEQARWQQEFAESQRRANEQLAEARRQAALQQNLMASIAQRQNASVSRPSGGGAKPIYNQQGQIAGFDTPTKSFLTPAGQAQEDAFWKSRNTSYSLDNLVSNVKNALGGAGKFWGSFLSGKGL